MVLVWGGYRKKIDEIYHLSPVCVHRAERVTRVGVSRRQERDMITSFRVLQAQVISGGQVQVSTHTQVMLILLSDVIHQQVYLEDSPRPRGRCLSRLAMDVGHFEYYSYHVQSQCVNSCVRSPSLRGSHCHAILSRLSRTARSGSESSSPHPPCSSPSSTAPSLPLPACASCPPLPASSCACSRGRVCV